MEQLGATDNRGRAQRKVMDPDRNAVQRSRIPDDTMLVRNHDVERLPTQQGRRQKMKNETMNWGVCLMILTIFFLLGVGLGNGLARYDEGHEPHPGCNHYCSDAGFGPDVYEGKNMFGNNTCLCEQKCEDTGNAIVCSGERVVISVYDKR